MFKRNPFFLIALGTMLLAASLYGEEPISDKTKWDLLIPKEYENDSYLEDLKALAGRLELSVKTKKGISDDDKQKLSLRSANQWAASTSLFSDSSNPTKWVLLNETNIRHRRASLGRLWSVLAEGSEASDRYYIVIWRAAARLISFLKVSKYDFTWHPYLSQVADDTDKIYNSVDTLIGKDAGTASLDDLELAYIQLCVVEYPSADSALMKKVKGAYFAARQKQTDEKASNERDALYETAGVRTAEVSSPEVAVFNSAKKELIDSLLDASPVDETEGALNKNVAGMVAARLAALDRFDERIWNDVVEDLRNLVNRFVERQNVPGAVKSLDTLIVQANKALNATLIARVNGEEKQRSYWRDVANRYRDGNSAQGFQWGDEFGSLLEKHEALRGVKVKDAGVAEAILDGTDIFGISFKRKLYFKHGILMSILLEANRPHDDVTVEVAQQVVDTLNKKYGAGKDEGANNSGIWLRRWKQGGTTVVLGLGPKVKVAYRPSETYSLFRINYVSSAYDEELKRKDQDKKDQNKKKSEDKL
jgi:hypothetical protein